MGSRAQTPVVVINAFPAAGHSNSLIQAADYLVKKGFPAYFVCSTEFGPSIKKTGAVFCEHTWAYEHDGVEGREQLQGPDLLIFDLKRVFIDSAPMVYATLKQALETAREQHPGREVVVLQESASVGLWPFVCGAPLPKGYERFPKIVNFHTLFNITWSKDVFPFGLGLPPPTTDEERAQVAAMNEGTKALFKVLGDYADEVFKPLGATKPLGDYFDAIMLTGDVVALQYSPSLDYPRSDLDPKCRFLGLMPLKGLGSDFVAPAWLEELQAIAKLPADSPDKKKIIFVSQGTVANEMEDMILPALKAFSDRSDLRLVATLGHRGRTLPDGFELPANATVIDYFPYDAILPITDVFLTNAGFGGYSHGIMNGVPMVMSGLTQDKPEVSRRAEWAGVAVNLHTQRPTAEALIEGVDKVLADPSYKNRALELKAENEALNPLDTLEKIIWELLQ
ncbi:MGT family glycosyltransferase [Xylariales sp. PMI_506]|nr:MGT family glycosyltransferase [Xylariales sp. PMI_506]